MSGFKTCLLCCWWFSFFLFSFFYRSIRSTVSVCVTLTAAAAPPPPAPTAPWRTQACVPTTATTVAAKPATQRPTDRFGQDRPTQKMTARTKLRAHSAVQAHLFVHLCIIRPLLSLKIVFFLEQMKSKSACAARWFYLFSVEISLFQWNEMKNQFSWVKWLSWFCLIYFRTLIKMVSKQNE